MIGEWLRQPLKGQCVIFVHGFLSSGESCWRNSNGTYWPELLRCEPELDSVGIYVFSYQTGVFSGSYRLSDIVDALKEFMRLDHVSENRQLIFVCHSMGGIVVRKLLIEQVIDMIDKRLGLFLIASPSLGSTYADWFSPLAVFLGNSQEEALRFIRNNEWLQDLDKEFINLKESSKLKLVGKELVEDKFVIFRKFLRRQAVEPFSGARFFGDPFKVPLSDHFSIAKPKDKDAIQHRLLCRFILENLSSGGSDAQRALGPGSPSPTAALPQPLSASENANAPPDTIQPTTQSALSQSNPPNLETSSHTNEARVSSVTKVRGNITRSITGGVFHGDVKIDS